MNNYLIFLLCLCLTGCTGVAREDMHVEIADRITENYVKIVYQNDQLVPSGLGGGMVGDVQRITLDFDIVRNFDVTQARNLLIHKFEEFLTVLNENKEIRPYLHSYPFNQKELTFAIGFKKNDGSFVDPPYIAYALTSGRNISYNIYERQKKLRLVKVFSESYLDAYRIVFGCEKQF